MGSLVLFLAEAPAVSLAQHADALQEELEDHEPLPLSTTGVLGCQHKNSSRQYKRVVARFGMALKLGCGPVLFLQHLLLTKV